MANLILKTWNVDQVATAVREALPRNPKVTVVTTTYPGCVRHDESKKLRLKGVAAGNGGLVFTFDDSSRRTLLPENQAEGDDGKISVTSYQEPSNSWSKKSSCRAKVKFTDSTGAPITITLPW